MVMPGVQSSFNLRCDSLHDEMLIKTELELSLVRKQSIQRTELCIFEN